LRENAKFCHQCGTATAVWADAAQYKQVTVLFADVVRSMDIAARVDVERLREIIGDLVERCAVVVHRYDGTVESTGDGVMALFGAPVALEDHAFRGCLAALDIQEEAKRLAVDVQNRDGVALRLRVGLNSGRVIAGEIGSGALGYTVTGEPVGFAQRMESVAPPGGVMVSESTARLVDGMVKLAEPEWVRIKGSDEPVRARRLLGISPRDGVVGRAEASLIGRRWEMAALDALLDRVISGRGGVVNVAGPPGIGKSRVAREAAALAAGRGVEVIWTFCESHATDISFAVVSRMLRAGIGVADLDEHAARARLRAVVPDADPQDLLLLDDLLGIADPDVPLPAIDPDARRRRLTALINTALLARTAPALFIIEDTHWIDAVSEAMIADLLAVLARSPTLVLTTARPEYQGRLTRVHGSQTIALAPLDNSDSNALLGELLGSDPSVGELAAVIAERAAGNPFFTEEMVRELAQRGVLVGERGAYISHVDVADVAVPATVQAAIEARIDRLSAAAKKTLNAASVIGARFGPQLLTALGVDAVFDELLGAELIDQVRFAPSAEFAFHHPLIGAVAYESQLKADRAELHRRLATTIQQSEPASVDENAALIAQHLESAGEPHAAYEWHMRAGAWSANRDLFAARLGWDRARRMADQLPDDDPAQLSMRIAPRTMLLGTGWRVDANIANHFDELRELCGLNGDKISLAIGLAGLVGSHVLHGRMRDASRLASEQMALLESLGDPPPTLGLAFIAFATWFECGDFGQLVRRSQTVIDLVDGDPRRGAGFGVDSPLALALTWRGVARWWLGRPGWRQDLHDAAAMARRSNAGTIVAVRAWTYGLAIYYGVLRADDSALRALEEAVQTAERGGDEYMLGVGRYNLGVALLNRDAAADRDRGLELVVEARDVFLRVHSLFLVPLADLWAARENARRGDHDAAIPVMRQAVDELHRAGRLGYGVWGTGVLVETLLERGDESDLAEAQDDLDRLANLPDDGSAVREVTLLRLRTLLARAHGDVIAYRDLLKRYLAIAESLDYEGHIAWAKAMGQLVPPQG
jgi:class 3 adenylate cyclase/tetratricopeptide (TPR) repeat protein/RecA/RadA recombinase